MKKTNIFFICLLFIVSCKQPIIGDDFVEKTAEFKIATWNAEWLSCTDPGYGKDNRELQVNNVVAVIKALGADVVALQEIGTSNIYTTIDTLVRRLGSEWAGDIVPWRSDNCSQNQGIIYKKSKIQYVNSSLIKNGGSAYDWSSGRFPALYNVNFLAGSKQIPVSLVNIHAKAFSDVGSYARREAASKELKTLLNGSTYNTKRIIVLGDFNDYLKGTLCWSCGGVSPYKNFMDDAANYKGITSDLIIPNPLPYSGSPVIDNIIISNELFENYVSNSTKIETFVNQHIPDYRNTTSDHYPVSATFRFVYKEAK